MVEGDRIKAGDLGLGVSPASLGSMELKGALEEAELAAVTRALSAAGGNLSQAARHLGVSRPTLYRLLRSHGLKE